MEWLVEYRERETSGMYSFEKSSTFRNIFAEDEYIIADSEEMAKSLAYMWLKAKGVDPEKCDITIVKRLYYVVQNAKSKTRSAYVTTIPASESVSSSVVYMDMSFNTWKEASTYANDYNDYKDEPDVHLNCCYRGCTRTAKEYANWNGFCEYKGMRAPRRDVTLNCCSRGCVMSAEEYDAWDKHSCTYREKMNNSTDMTHNFD